ncbi:MAG TPA: bifunctional riboflavin kinase/FAD synthetase [Vicinamibacterales bacterium]|nr:bifunctional riboflavin kinase/FAD synthetase [Acidobacteriota bacterium]HQX80895.1 bifunctional riboflavin kinase/FAD synthetase [Vicinamibacterales bacterium]
MHIAHFPADAPPHWPRPVAALGNFDGVHRGHQKILDRVKAQAAACGGNPVVVTFDPHPPRVVRPDKAPLMLMTLAQRLETFERAGVYGVAVVHFTPEMARWEPEAFVDRVLVDWLQVAEVWVGANFLFGRERLGTFTLLKALGEDRGFLTGNIEPVRYRDFVVSSTRIRRLIGEGRVGESAELLGHYYFLDGVVVHGEKRGRLLGFPTANLHVANELLPAYGIYATIAVVDGVRHPAVTSLGVRPTITGDGPVTVETHLLDGAMDLYGSSMRLEFVEWLRPEEKFDSLEALSAQIGLDCEAGRRVIEREGL